MRAGTALKLAGVVVIVISIIIGTVWLLDWFQVDYQYRSQIGAHIDNAYDASTFVIMRENLLKAKQGMIDAGLEPSDCGRAWSWERTQDWCMAYQYQYIDGMVNRTEYYIGVFSKNNTPPFEDVYEKAMNNMRNEFNRNGPLDWVARPAWYLKNHSFYYWSVNFWITMLVGFFGILFLIFGFAADDYF